MGTRSFPGVKCSRGVLLTTQPLLVPRSWKSRAIPIPTLWAKLVLNGITLPFTFYHTFYVASDQIQKCWNGIKLCTSSNLQSHTHTHTHAYWHCWYFYVFFFIFISFLFLLLLLFLLLHLLLLLLLLFHLLLLLLVLLFLLLLPTQMLSTSITTEYWTWVINTSDLYLRDSGFGCFL